MYADCGWPLLDCGGIVLGCACCGTGCGSELLVGRALLAGADDCWPHALNKAPASTAVMPDKIRVVFNMFSTLSSTGSVNSSLAPMEPLTQQCPFR